MKLFIETVFWNWVSLITGLMSVASYYVCVFLLNTNVAAKLL